MQAGISLPVVMRTIPVLVMLLVSISAGAASKPHVISFGKPQQVKLSAGASESKTVDITVSPLFVDTKLKEYTIGKQHDVTDRQFVVRRAFASTTPCPRMRTSLPSGFGSLGDGCW